MNISGTELTSDRQGLLSGVGFKFADVTKLCGSDPAKFPRNPPCLERREEMERLEREVFRIHVLSLANHRDMARNLRFFIGQSVVSEST